MLAFAQNALFYVVPALLVLGLIVTIHELGHFLTARAFGVAVDRFSVGFGRAMLSRVDRHGTEWRLGWIPLGGYVRFSGDENDASVPDTESLDELREHIIAREGPAAVSRYLHFKPLWQRALVVAAGPLANFALAIAIFAFVAGIFGGPYVSTRISGAEPGTAAARAGFMPGDVIQAGDGQRFSDWEELSRFIVLRENRRVDFEVLRNGRVIILTADIPRTQIRNALNLKMFGGSLGVRSSDASWRRYNPVEAVAFGVKRTWNIIDTTVFYVGRIIQGQVSAEAIGGPLQMAQVSGAITKATAADTSPLGYKILNGIINLFLFAATVSVGIGFVNLLPIPVLDGGHLLFYAYEAVARRPMAVAVQAAGYRVGLALLLGLMLFATWNDLQRFNVFSYLGGLFS